MPVTDRPHVQHLPLTCVWSRAKLQLSVSSTDGVGKGAQPSVVAHAYILGPERQNACFIPKL